MKQWSRISNYECKNSLQEELMQVRIRKIAVRGISSVMKPRFIAKYIQAGFWLAMMMIGRQQPCYNGAIQYSHVNGMI